jgi:hypothetical protein
MKRPVSYLSGVLAISFVVGICHGASPVLAKPQPKEWVKYLNPLPQKNYTLNKNQDRAIKKKGFKKVVVEGAKAVANREIGLFATISRKDFDNTELVSKLLDKQEVNGISATFTWKDVNPQEDKYEWSKIDNLLKLAKEHDKSVILRISTAGSDLESMSDTPDWVIESDVKTLSFKDPAGKDHKMPIFWDSTYLAKWSNFVQDLGARYDKNPAIHSIGITGGGVEGGTLVVPELNVPINKENYKALETTLTKDHGMSQRQLVEHWKYVAELFPKAFPTQRLNFNIDPPTPNRAGQDSLDEISDYLVYRYGQRVYLSRMNVNDAKHGFDQYRVMLKFKPDTLTGYKLTDKMQAAELTKIGKIAFDDGASFIEIPSQFFDSQDEAVKLAIKDLREHLGYQLISQKVTLPEGIKAGEPIKVSFTFANIGAATAMRPVRELDKDVASSYRLMVELKNANGKTALAFWHTPGVPTNKWTSGKPITWEGELKPTKSLKPGEYSVYFSLMDPDTKRKINFLDGMSQEPPKLVTSIGAGKLKVE